MTNILFVGDVHGKFNYINEYIKDDNPSMVISTGDFGYYPTFFEENIKNINFEKPVYFIDGNHEDHWALKKLENNVIKNNLIYQPRGSYINVNKHNILFLGGANSIDKHSRIVGYDWFPEEILTEKDIYNIDDSINYDIIVTHTCPQIIFDKYLKLKTIENDFSRTVLQYVFEKYIPKLWIFSHFHDNLDIYHNDCRFIMLNMVPLINCKYFLKI